MTIASVMSTTPEAVVSPRRKTGGGENGVLEVVKATIWKPSIPAPKMPTSVTCVPSGRSAPRTTTRVIVRSERPPPSNVTGLGKIME